MIRRFVLLLSLTALPVSAVAQESTVTQLRSSGPAATTDAELALGRALRRAGHETEAIAELRKGLAMRPADGGIAFHWEIARSLVARRDFSQAMIQCRVLGALPRATADGHACAAEAHNLWKRASEALGETALALANGNKNYDAKVAEGQAHEFELKESDAEKSYREAIGWRADRAEAHLALGRLLVRMGKDTAGLEELRAALSIDSSWPEAELELGTALAGTEALAHLERAVRERPTYAAAWRKIAETQLALGRIADTRKSVETVLKLEPDAAAHVLSGRLALAEGKPDDALKEGEAGLKILANSAAAKLLVADAQAKKGEIDLAVEAYQAAYGLDHADPTPLVNASVACHAAGRETSARAFGLKATQDFPQWGPGWVALGDALAADKDPAHAREAYQAALKAKGAVDIAAVQRKIAQLR
jgi:tetratricopeptide (TPR) repeat protein